MFKRLIVCIVGFLIRLRYRIVVEGSQDLELKMKSNGGILFLPNHSAEIDPPILMSVLWAKFRPRPLVVDDYYYAPGLRIFMDLIGALPCPNMEYGVNRWKVRQLDKLQDRIGQGLREGQNYLIYPSGKLKLSSREVIGGASFVPALLHKERAAKVVLVRMSGLWGSRFSTALTGKSPNFGENLLASFWILLKNGLFFTPRRTVRIELLPAPEDFPYRDDRSKVNGYLESWYNAKPDPLTLVSYSFWKKELPAVTDGSPKETPATNAVPSQNVVNEIAEKIAELANIPATKVAVEKQLIRDLGLDSLDIAQLLLFLDEKYQVGQVQMDTSWAVGDLLNAIASKQATHEDAHAVLAKPVAVPVEKNRPAPLPPQGKTIMEAFLRVCDRMPGAIACMDATSGVLPYRKLKIAVLLLADEIRKMPGKNIGIMLPSSVGAYLIILATLCAGKTPVMLNWTVGAKAVDHAVNAAGIEAVISSLRFINRLKNLEIGSAEDKIVLLEDVRREITLGKKLRALLRSYQGADALLKSLGLSSATSSDPAVILFTSGTEALPKGVPLSHGNIISNQTAAIQVTDIYSTDLLYGVLPPFHSFGFSITGLLPLLSGLKILYAPDPTNHRGMVRDIATYKPTFFFCAPTFIRSLFHAARPEDLQSLRLIVTGAEKAGKELFDYVKVSLPNARLLEGYGITECGPIVTLCRTYKPEEGPEEGVGRPLPGIEVLFLDPETQEICPPGKEGEICIAGPGIFSGYLGIPKNPFIEKKGLKWYRSGDIGYMTAHGSLVLSGRLKRFVKIGGEMISLGGLEEEIAELAKEKGWISASFGGKDQDQEQSLAKGIAGPDLALCSHEQEGHKTALVLFTSRAIDKEALNVLLKQRGHSNLTRISEIRTVKEIPLTGTGKTNYRLLEEMIG